VTPTSTDFDRRPEGARDPGLLPPITPDTAAFLTGGAEGQLLIQHCSSCSLFIHPPSPRCPNCLTTEVAPVAVSGDGTVGSCSVNHYAWHPNFPPPYVIAIVELDEQPGLRLTTRLVGDGALGAEIGDRVHVVFEPHDNVWLPLFSMTSPEDKKGHTHDA